MNKNSNTYIFIYSIVLVSLVALILAILATKLKPKQDQNIAIENKRNILSAIQIESTAKNAENLFDKYIIEQNIVDYQGNIIKNTGALEADMKTEINKNEVERQLPVFIAKLDNGSVKHIFPLYGKGLWGPIWGYVALNDDMSTIYGCVFAHKGETPGLGAEIDTKDFQKKFNNKEIFNSNNEFVSIKLAKEGQNVKPEHSVDAISGGTITSRGLEEMIEDCLEMYLNYFKKINE